MLAIEARTQRDVAMADLARLVGVAPDQPIEPTADLARATTGLATSRGEWRSRRVGPRAASGTPRASAASRLRPRRSATRPPPGALPTIQVLGGVDYARPNPKIFPRDGSISGLVGRRSRRQLAAVGWWPHGRGSGAGDRRVSGGARSGLPNSIHVLGVEVRQRALEVESAVAAVAAATSGVTAAADARRVVEERYRAGVIAEIEVLDAEYALLQAQLDLTRAQAAVRLAEAQLTRALGR